MNERVPEGWEIRTSENIYVRLKVPKVYDRNMVEETGSYPVLDQSTCGEIGFLESDPDFVCDINNPIVTFANHTCAVRKMTTPFGVIQNVFPLTSRSDTDIEFIFQILNGGVEQEGYKGHYPKLRETEFLLPPLPEQKKIASILTSVDEVIETTQKQIEKLQDLKKATMNELLTKGIGHTEFKDSELGRIPKSWQLVKLGETGKWKGGGTPSKSKPEFWVGNIPWVSPKDMKYEYISQTEDYVSDFAVANSSTNLIDAGAILIVVRSGILKHTLPVAISKCDLTVNQDMKALSVSKNFSNLFIYHYLMAKNHLVLRSTLKAGNTVESIDTQVFSEYLIPSPPLHEQIEIANIIETIASQIRKKKQKFSQTQSLKKSLMQDLLTGKVRVQVN